MLLYKSETAKRPAFLTKYYAFFDRGVEPSPLKILSLLERNELRLHNEHYTHNYDYNAATTYNNFSHLAQTDQRTAAKESLISTHIRLALTHSSPFQAVCRVH